MKHGLVRAAALFGVAALPFVTAQVLLTGEAKAAGFALKEQSGSALGNAFAGGTANAEDVTYMFFNPAGLARHDGMQAAAVVSYIRPESEVVGSSAATIVGSPILGRNRFDDISSDAVVPAFYGSLPLTEDFTLGLGVNAPFGLETNYDDDWVGRYHAIDSELLTVNVNPAVAWQVDRWLAVGAGLQIQYADAELSNAIDFGTIGTALPPMLGLPSIPGAIPGDPSQDGKATLNGDDWGFGWNLGFLVTPTDNTRFGFAYRSKIKHKIEGSTDFDRSAIGDALAGATGLFVDSGAEASLTLPDSYNFGFAWDIDPRWTVMGEYQLTRWSEFDELRIRFDNPVQPDSVTDESWEDSHFIAAGVTFRPSSSWAIRGGVAFDDTPVPDSTRTPRVPDESRYWIAVGASYAPFDWLTLDAGYTHIFVNDAEVDLAATDTGNTFRGGLTASYNSSIDILTFQGRVRF
jgi:long-chain fatty acid transport protein